MKVPAFEWENSIKVELNEIKRVSKSYLVASCDDFNEKNASCNASSAISVNVYEQHNRYHYHVRMNCDMPDEEVRCFSSSKECNPQVVARYILAAMDGRYDAED